MTRIAEVLAEGPTFSYEFFPPKTDAGREVLDATVDALAVTEPSFVSVTYGAGGSTRTNTRDIVIDIDSSRPFPAMPHLTCVGHRAAELEELLDQYLAAGIENVLALAGDPPADGSPADGDFTYASELIDLVRARGRFSVAVAAHPELHPRSTSREDDRKFLAAKLEAADFGITQFFFDVDHYTRMMDELAALGCTTPVIPGVMPLLNPTTIRRFSGIAGATFPEDLATRVDSASEQDALEIACDAAIELSDRLLDAGAPGLHIYALNRSEAALRIHGAVGDRIRGRT